MKEMLKNEVRKYVKESKENWSEEIQDHYFDEPIIRFASANDQLFEEYKQIIGNDHLTPQEALEIAFGKGNYHEGTVISVLLPISEKIKKSNRAQKEHSSKEWALLRTFGDEIFIKGLTQHLVDFLCKRGYRTVAPSYTSLLKLSTSDSGLISNWSERHIAYAAGHGTFSLNDGLISEKGMAIRLVSVATELKLDPDARTANSLGGNCLFCSKGTCGACISRCPVGAISFEGHDKIKCFKFVYGEESRKRAESYGGDPKNSAGCGLCQTKVPCESRNPVGNAF